MRLATRGLLPAIIIVTAFTGSARAADLGPYGSRQRWDAPPQAYSTNAFRWTGFYGGVQAGYGWSGTDATSATLSTGTTEAFSYSTNGAIGGIHAGYNWQINSIVLGLETDLEMSGIGGSSVGTLGGGHSTNIDWMGSFRGRAGFTTGATLFYLTGGLAYGNVSVDRSAGAGFTPFIGASEFKTGWTLGAGVEHAFTSTISARPEYSYTDFGTINYTSLPSNLNDSSAVSSNAIRAGLSFKF
jgi:outer membrane immunogenic protein